MQNELYREIDAQIAAFPAKTAVLSAWLPAPGAPAVPGLPVAGCLYGCRAEESVVSASTVKVAVLLTALSLCAQGALRPEEPVSLPEAAILPDTQVFEAENRRPAYPLWELLYWMTVESDNTATNRLLDLLGMDAVNEFCRRWGLAGTVVRRKMLDWDAVAAGKNNFTSLADQYRLYALLNAKSFLPPALRALGWRMLAEQRFADGILRYLPRHPVFAHKSGCLDFLEHDAGVFLGRRLLFAGVFTWDGPSPEGDHRQLRHIGKIGRNLYLAARDELGQEEALP